MDVRRPRDRSSDRPPDRLTRGTAMADDSGAPGGGSDRTGPAQGSDPDERLHELLSSHDSEPTVLDDLSDPMLADAREHDPEAHSIRTTWQSEAERLEAAEFLMATRSQQEARLRAQHVMDLRRSAEAARQR